MADIIDMKGKRVGVEIDPDLMLDQLKGKLQAFVLMGHNEQGDEVTVITYQHLPEALWIVERCKKRMMERPDE